MPGVRQVKATFSAYVAEVQTGKEVVITDRGRPVARLVPISPAGPSTGLLIDHLAEEGQVDLPAQAGSRPTWSPAAVSDGPAPSDLIRDDRR